MDPVVNAKNYAYTQGLGLTVPTFGKAKVESFFQEYERRQRRIDYIFVNSDIQVLSSFLFGEKPTKEGLIGSDHFGVVALLNIFAGGHRK